jgi:metallo-beta-lactamase family protein
MPRAPEHAYLMLGEPDAADSLRQALTEQLHWECSVPEHLELALLRERETAEP